MILFTFRQAFFLPERDKLGRLIIFSREGSLPASKEICRSVTLYYAILADVCLIEEENHIRGIVTVSDCSQLQFSHVSQFSPQMSLAHTKCGQVKHAFVFNTYVHIFNFNTLIEMSSNTCIRSSCRKYEVNYFYNGRVAIKTFQNENPERSSSLERL